MSANILEAGYKTAGFNQAGQYVESDVSLVRATVPGPNGEWMFVVIGNNFCWIHGLPSGQGYQMYKIPLTGGQATWQEQIKGIVEEGPKEDLPSETIPVGTQTALAQPRLFIVSE